MRRWTDGKSWSASRVSGSFLTYREMEGKRGGGNFVPVQRRHGGKTPDSGRGSEEDADMDGDGPDGYRYKADGLMKQSFSITTSAGQHLHLISYYARPHSNMPELPQPSTDPALRHIIPVKGMYPESTVHESASPMRSAPMSNAYMPPQMMGHPPQGMARGPYSYPQGYAPWPPSPMSTPPYNYPPGMYPSPLPLPASGHPHPYQGMPPHANLPPHLQHHLPPQQYDRSPLGHSQPHDSMQRYSGQQLPQMSSLGYSNSPQNNADRYMADPPMGRQMAPISQQQASDSRLPPPIQSQPGQAPMNGHLLQRVPSSHGQDSTLLPQPQAQSQPQQSPRLNGHHSPSQTASVSETKPSQSIPSISNIVHATEPSPVLAPVQPPTALAPMSSARQASPLPSSQETAQRLQQNASPESVRSESAAQILAEQAQQIAQAADAASSRSASISQSRGSASPTTSAAVHKAGTTRGSNSPETASVEADGSATPAEAGAPQDIPHAKLGATSGLNQEDHRAIRVLDRKFCI